MLFLGVEAVLKHLCHFVIFGVVAPSLAGFATPKRMRKYIKKGEHVAQYSSCLVVVKNTVFCKLFKEIKFGIGYFLSECHAETH